MRTVLCILVLGAQFGSFPVAAHADARLEWTNITLKTQQGGNAEIKMTRSFDGILLVASVRIHNGVPLKIPGRCWPQNRPIYYDNVDISHGTFPDNRAYWKFSFNVDESHSISGKGRFHLVVYSARIHSSYIEFLTSNEILQRLSLCGPEE